MQIGTTLEMQGRHVLLQCSLFTVHTSSVVPSLTNQCCIITPEIEKAEWMP